jgi:hypothetical protein
MSETDWPEFDALLVSELSEHKVFLLNGKVKAVK